MKEKTAVEWLVQELTLFETPKWVQEIIEQAKEMEKEQIVKAYENLDFYLVDGEDYYNKTFKQQDKSINNKG
jgi:hypothetical protein